MRLNLTSCSIEYLTGKYPEYKYNGTVRGIFKHVEPPPPLITVQGCKSLCGEGSDYYSWEEISSTITTWVIQFSHQVQPAAYTYDYGRFYPSSASSFRPPSKATKTSTASGRWHVGSATQSRASLTSCGTSKSLANVL